MNIQNLLTPELTNTLSPIVVNDIGALSIEFASKLMAFATRRVQKRLVGDDIEQALQRAAATAIASVVLDWALSDEHYRDVWDGFCDWLLSPTVQVELRVLLNPTPDAILDMDGLCDELEAIELGMAELSQQCIEKVVQDLIAGFYAVVADEPVLREPLQIDTLRQLAENTGALERLVKRQVALGRGTVSQLERLNLIANRVAGGSDETTELLCDIRTLLEELVNTNQTNQPTTLLDQQMVYEGVLNALSHAGISVGDLNDAQMVNIGDGNTINMPPDLSQIETLLKAILDNVNVQSQQLGVDELSQLESRYRQSLIQQFEKLTFRGISSSNRPIELPLEDVYVELKAIADIPEAADTYSADERRFMWEAEQMGLYEASETRTQLDVMRLERWRTEAREKWTRNYKNEENQTRLERRSIDEMVADPIHKGLVILGDPGSGKTTLLHYLALTYARPKVNAVPVTKLQMLPIFVPFAAYDDYLRRNPFSVSLEDFLPIYYEQWHSFPGLKPIFTKALQDGRVLLLLDGLDEVLETVTRQHVAKQAEAVIRQALQRGNRAIITSRVVGYREASLSGELQHVTVMDFGQAEVETFAKQWCNAHEVWLAGGKTPTALQQAAIEQRVLLDDISSNPSVARLAANPFLLVLLAVLRRQVGRLPIHRSELYERYVKLLLDRWEYERSLGARQQQRQPRFSVHKVIAYLIELAFWLQRNRPSGTASHRDLHQLLVDITLQFEGHHNPKVVSMKAQLDAQKNADAFIEDMRHFTGILAERGRDAFGFLHLTFQEYFAGRALAYIGSTPATMTSPTSPSAWQPTTRMP
ncbi:MAG: NACHT domain-containing protein, partial [Chloroflexota bacterium]